MNTVKAQIAPLHNKATTASFLTGLDPNDEKFDFQLGRGHERSEIFHGTLDDFWPLVEKANTPTHRADVFVLPNGFAGRQPRAFFAALTTKKQVDSAKAAITACDAKCDMIVRDASQTVLCYPCSDIPVDQYATAQRRLSTALGTDSTVVDLSRIRLPGTLGFDNPGKPQLVELLRNGASNDWKFDDLIGRLDSQGKPPEPNDNLAASEFQEKLRPGGPWVLTAIVPDGATMTITADTTDQGDAFVSQHDGQKNLYYSVNPTRTPLNKKAKKTDIAAIEYLHFDGDPRSDETPEAAKARYLKAIEQSGLKFAFGIDSGNGIQGLIRLTKRIELGPLVDGKFSPEDQAKVADVEARTKALTLRLGGDVGTQNIDRILRLPGTTNLPNAKKRKAGRTECQAKLLWFDDASYPLDAFPLHKENGGHFGGLGGSAATAFDKIEVAPKFRHLNPKHSLCESIIIPERDESGSGHGWRFMQDCHAKGMSYEEARKAILADNTEAGEWANRTDERQLKRAWERSKQEHSKPPDDDEALVAKWNERHAHVLAGGKSCVLQEFKTPEGYADFKLLSSAAFHEWYGEHQTACDVGGRVTLIEETKLWIRHPKRRKYEDIGFFPGREVPGFYNLWRGFAVEPRKGDCSKFLAHVYENVCQGNDDLYAWVMAWFADIFQHPALKCGTSLTLRGKQGTGKTKVGEVVGSLLGVHYKPVAEPRFITGQFNSHMLSLLMLHADEGFWAGDKKAEGKLKDLITGKKHPIEFKGKEAFWVDNLTRLFSTGNPDWQVPAAFEERRFAVLDMGDAHRNDYPYFAAIDAEMAAGGREALLHYLLHEVDCSKVNLRQIPQTTALLEQKLETASPEQGWWLDILQRGALPGYHLDNEPQNEVSVEVLFDDYIEHAKKQGVSRRVIETTLGIFLRKAVGPRLRRERRSHETQNLGFGPIKTRPWIYIFPSLSECRQAFIELHDQKTVLWGGKEEEWN